MVPRCFGYCRDELLAGGQHRGETAFHVRRAAPVQQPVADDRLEWIAAPLIQRPRRHHVGVAREAEYRAAAAALGPKIIDRAETQALDGEARGREPLDHQRLAAAVGGTDGLTRNQLLGQLQGLGHQKRKHRRLAAQVDPHSPGAEHHGADQHPRRHREPEKFPGYLGALAGAGEHLDQHLAQRKHLEHEIERCAACRHAVGGQALEIQMPQRHADRGQRRQAEQHRVHAAGRRPPGSCRAAIRNNTPSAEYADPLKNAQRTGLQVHHELGVVGVGQQARAGQKSEKIPSACRHQRRMSACAASICLATSSSEEWRISLPCTM